MECLKSSQKLPLSQEECWNFFSSPLNLKIITPEHLGFAITNDPLQDHMYPGQIISYTIRPILNIPMEWVTEITQVQAPHYFIDEQRIGPYKFWHHEHRFIPVKNGVEMIDLVYYQMPFGFIGKFIHFIKIKKELEYIFAYRKKKLEHLFGSI